jgi:hypothetical protein
MAQLGQHALEALDPAPPGIGRQHAVRGAQEQRTPSMSSSRAMAWLTADCEVPMACATPGM